MKRYLLDTHTFLWFVLDAPELSKTAKANISDGTNEIFVSLASFWEISIKNAVGKLNLDSTLDELLETAKANDMTVLPINFEHIKMNNRLPLHHRDPFDRILIAQAMVEQMDILGKDDVFDEYFLGELEQRVW